MITKYKECKLSNGPIEKLLTTPTSNSIASSQVSTAKYGRCSNKKASGFLVNCGTVRPKPGASRKVVIPI